MDRQTDTELYTSAEEGTLPLGLVTMLFLVLLVWGCAGNTKCHISARQQRCQVPSAGCKAGCELCKKTVQHRFKKKIHKKKNSRHGLKREVSPTADTVPHIYGDRINKTERFYGIHCVTSFIFRKKKQNKHQSQSEFKYSRPGFFIIFIGFTVCGCYLADGKINRCVPLQYCHILKKTKKTSHPF